MAKAQERVICPTCTREVTTTITCLGADSVVIGASKAASVTLAPWTPVVVTRRHKANGQECKGGIIREYVR